MKRWWKAGSGGILVLGLLLAGCSSSPAGVEQELAPVTRQAEPTRHPADVNRDGNIGISEVTSYGSAWKSGATWATGPNPIPIGYITNAGALWKQGETYRHDGTANPPFVSGPAPSRFITGRVVDSRDGSTGVADATVTAIPTTAGRQSNVSTRTDSQGNYTLNVDDGHWNLQVRVSGFQTTTVPAEVGSNMNLTLTLVPNNTSIASGSLSPPAGVESFEVGRDYQFTATVTDSSGSTLPLRPSWIVNGGVGTISNTGLFHPTATGTGQVVASFTTNAVYRANLTVVSAPVGVRVTIDPQQYSMDANGAKEFNATVTGSNNTEVVWSVVGGDENGSITNAGVYTASGKTGTVTIKATSAADNTASDTAVVTVKPRLYLSGDDSMTSLREVFRYVGFTTTMQTGLPADFGDYEIVIVSETSGVRTADAALLEQRLIGGTDLILLGDVPVRLATGNRLSDSGSTDIPASISRWFGGVTSMRRNSSQDPSTQNTDDRFILPSGLSAGTGLGRWNGLPNTTTVSPTAVKVAADYSRVYAFLYQASDSEGELYWQFTHSRGNTGSYIRVDNLLIAAVRNLADLY